MGISATGRRPKQNKRARGKSGEKESGFARLPRCRPAESDLARSARKSKKSYWAPVPPFKMSVGAALSPETRGLPERGLGVCMSWGRGTPGAGRRRTGRRKVPLTEDPTQREPYRRKVALLRAAGRPRHANTARIIPPWTSPCKGYPVRKPATARNQRFRGDRMPGPIGRMVTSSRGVDCDLGGKQIVCAGSGIDRAGQGADGILAVGAFEEGDLILLDEAEVGAALI